MIKNIRHIQIKKIAYHPNLFKAILTFEGHGMIPNEYDESDDLEYIKYLENNKKSCPKCDDLMSKRREMYRFKEI